MSDQDWQTSYACFQERAAELQAQLDALPSQERLKLDGAARELSAAGHDLARSYQQLSQQHAIAGEPDAFRKLFERVSFGLLLLGPDLRFLHVNQRFCDMLGYTHEELLSHTFNDVTYPPDREITRNAYRQVLSGKLDQIELEKRYVHRNGAIVWGHMSLLAARAPDGTLRYILSEIQDITVRKQIEAAEREQRVLAAALQDTAIALTSTLDLSEVLDRILENVGHVVPHDTADIFFIEDDAAYIVRSRGYGQKLQERLAGQRFELSTTPSLQHMLETGQSVIIEDTQAYEGWIFVPGLERLRSVVSMPLWLQQNMIGFLNLNSMSPRFFTQRDVARLMPFASQAAIAIHNARSYEQVQALAAIEERQRLARDLHDAVSQSLFSASIIAESLPRLWKRDPARAVQNLEELAHLNRSALAEMRMLLLELRPTQLLKMNLPDQLRQLVQALQGRKRIEFDLLLDDQRLLPVDVQIVFYRIAQEALNNVSKHSNARHVTLHYHSGPDGAELLVADDGGGFDLARVHSGLGLDSMRERAESIGATLIVESAPGLGTRIKVAWISPAAAADPLE